MTIKKIVLLWFIFTAFLSPLFSETHGSTTSGKGTTSGHSTITGKGTTSGHGTTSGKGTASGHGTITGKSTVTVNEGGIGVYNKVVNKTENDVYNSVTNNVYNNIENDVYANGYGKYLKLVTEKGVDAERNFVKYFSDWQWSGQKEDFYTYSASRAEQEKQIALCYDTAIKKFGAGTAIVATTWVVSFVVPGGTVYQAAVLIIAKSTTIGAFSGGAIGAVSSAGIAYLQGKRGDELLYDTVKGASDGYLIGSITGLAEGSVKVAKLFNEAKKLKDFSGVETIFDGKVYDANGKLIGKYDKKWYPTEKGVRDAEKAGLQNLTSNQKGQYGEMKTDLFMRERGYERISKTHVTNINEKAPQGIDGVYYNPTGEPKYIIAEAKCGYQTNGEFWGKSALSTPADGIEMSNNWIIGKTTGTNRLEKAVGKEAADKILYEEGYEKVVVHVNNENGKCTAFLLDDLDKDVNIIGRW